jgi:hypothetical protein
MNPARNSTMVDRFARNMEMPSLRFFPTGSIAND